MYLDFDALYISIFADILITFVAKEVFFVNKLFINNGLIDFYFCIHIYTFYCIRVVQEQKLSNYIKYCTFSVPN